MSTRFVSYGRLAKHVQKARFIACQSTDLRVPAFYIPFVWGGQAIKPLSGASNSQQVRPNAPVPMRYWACRDLIYRLGVFVTVFFTTHPQIDLNQSNPPILAPLRVRPSCLAFSTKIFCARVVNHHAATIIAKQGISKKMPDRVSLARR